MDMLTRLANAGVVPVIVLNRVEDAVPTAKALLAGGIDVMEITFRTAAAAECIRAVAEQVPGMIPGAGTVLNVEQAKKAVEMGAKFIVSPGFDPETVKWCIDNNVPVTPGCVTPTEIMAAKAMGLNVVKFFPAGVYGGLKALKALSAPFVGMKFIPTGGVSEENLAEFLKASFIHAVGGSWVCTAKDVDEGNWDGITAKCAAARAILKEVRG